MMKLKLRTGNKPLMVFALNTVSFSIIVALS